MRSRNQILEQVTLFRGKVQNRPDCVEHGIIGWLLELAEAEWVQLGGVPIVSLVYLKIYHQFS